MFLCGVWHMLELASLRRPLVNIVRQKHRVYIQKPYPRPKKMQVIEDLSYPILGLESRVQNVSPCALPEHIAEGTVLTEYEQFLTRRLLEYFERSKDGMVAAFHPPSVAGRDWREIKIKFTRNGINLKVFHPRIISEAVKQTKFRELNQLLPAPLVLGFSEEPRTLGLSVALKLCPDMHLLTCVVYDRMLSRGQLDKVNNVGSSMSQVVAQSIMISEGLVAQLAMILRNGPVETRRILKAYCEKETENKD